MNRVRTLEVKDAPALIALRHEALEAEPLAFASSVGDDPGLSPEFVRRSLAETAESVVVGFFAEGALVGMTGIARLGKAKLRHKAHLWGVYVRPAHRGQGVASALIRAAIEQARRWPGVLQIHLGVTEAAVRAGRLYERAGFREWGREPRALAWEGRFVDERHLVLQLDSTV